MKELLEMLNLLPTATAKQVDKAFIKKLQKLQSRKDDAAAERLRTEYMKYLSNSFSERPVEKRKEGTPAAEQRVLMEEEIPESKEALKETTQPSKAPENKEGPQTNTPIEEEKNSASPNNEKEECQSPGRKVVGDVVIEEETPEPTRIHLASPNQRELILMKGESTRQQSEAPELSARIVEERAHTSQQKAGSAEERQRAEQQPPQQKQQQPQQQQQHQPQQQLKDKPAARKEKAAKSRESQPTNPPRQHYLNRPHTARARDFEEEHPRSREENNFFSILDDYFNYKNGRRNQAQEERRRLNQTLNSLSQTRGTSLLDLLRDTQRAQADYFKQEQENAEEEDEKMVEEKPQEKPAEKAKENQGHFESYHISTHQHIIGNGKDRYMKSYSETSKNVNGKKESTVQSVEKNFNGENTFFEKIEGSDGNVQTRKCKIPEDEFQKRFGCIDNLGFRSLLC